MIKTILRFNYIKVDIEFPCTEQMMQKKLDFLYLPKNLSDCMRIEEIKEPKWLKMLEA